MPFTGKELSTEKLIDISETTRTLKSGECVCPLCEQPFIPKYGRGIKTPHFAHTAQIECASGYGSHPESPEHRQAKVELAKLLKVEGAEVFKEVPIPEAKRIADILAIYPNGQKIVHEIQLSAILTKDLLKRTRDYSKAGLGVSWWLGKDANIDRNHETLMKLLGYSIEIALPFTEISEKSIRYIRIERRVVPYLNRMVEEFVPVIIKIPYPFLTASEETQAEWFKFVGTNGRVSIGRIIGWERNLVQIQRLSTQDDVWSYVKPEKGLAIFGKLNRSVIYTIS